MWCPFCSSEDTRVIDSRLGDDGGTVRRRRECQACSERFTTFERAEISMPWVIKNDGRREAFDEPKMRRGFLRALEKRPVASEAIDHSITRILRACAYSGEREVSTKDLGEWIMDELKEIDHVAYVRFASVYRRFQDLDAFGEEVDKLRNSEPVKGGTQLSFISDRKRGK